MDNLAVYAMNEHSSQRLLKPLSLTYAFCYTLLYTTFIQESIDLLTHLCMSRQVRGRVSRQMAY